jgi:hypothetical protein
MASQVRLTVRKNNNKFNITELCSPPLLADFFYMAICKKMDYNLYVG